MASGASPSPSKAGGWDPGAGVAAVLLLAAGKTRWFFPGSKQEHHGGSHGPQAGERRKEMNSPFKAMKYTALHSKGSRQNILEPYYSKMNSTYCICNIVYWLIHNQTALAVGLLML